MSLTNSLSSWERTPSFTQDIYSFSGFTDQSALLHDSSAAEYIRKLVNKDLRAKPADQVLGAEGGTGNFDGIDGSAKVVFAWRQEGAPTLTYGLCAKGIDILVTWLETEVRFNNHPIRFNILLSGNVRIVVQIQLEKGEEVDLMTDTKIFINADFYPKRTLRPPDVRAVLYAAESEDDWHESQPHPSPVREKAVQSYQRGRVHLEIRFWAPQGQDWPEFTYKDLSIMMHELERFFLKRGAYAELYGTLSLSGKEERDIRDVGNMKIYLDSHFFAVAASNASSSTFVLPVDITA